MSTSELTDCLRATPSRTLAALTRELSSRAKRRLRGLPSYPAASLSERTRADIGLTAADTHPATERAATGPSA